uniref:Uncharacterized protein n=1 Tax=Kalanchoe fedtschenkoi TaxID=63787 RepID=A0A7N0TCT6_KALFE
MGVSIFYNDPEHVESPLPSVLLRSFSFNGWDFKSPDEIGTKKMIIEGSLCLELDAHISFKSSCVDNGDDDRLVQSLHFQCKKMVEHNIPRSNSFGCESKDEELQKSDSLTEEFHELEPSESCDIERNLAALKLQKVYKSFRTRRQLADCAVLVEQKWWKLLDFAELKRSSISFFDIEKPENAISRWSRARTKAAKVGKGLSKDEKARKLALQHWLEAIDPRHRYGHNLQFYYANWLHCESKQPFFYWLDIGEGKEVNLDRCSRGKLQQQCIKYLGPKSPDEVEEQEFNLINWGGTGSEYLLSHSKDEHSDRPEIPRPPVSKLSRKLRSKITALEIPARQDVLELLRHEEESEEGNGFITCRPLYSPESSTDDGYETAEDSFLTEEDFMVSKANLFDESHEEEEDPVLKEQILMRINSHKGMRSYQLGNQLSCKWTTGAGPRIGCMRDYPSEIRFRILEQAHLSPRNKTTNTKRAPSRFGSVASTPTGFSEETLVSSSFSQMLSQTSPQ